MSQNHYLIKKMIYLVTLTAISVVLGLFEIPLAPGVDWLKLDLSEVIVLITFMILGFKNTFILIILRGITRQFIQGDILIPTELWGEVIALIASLTLVGSYYLLSRLLGRHDKPLFNAAYSSEPFKFWESIVIIFGVTIILSLVLLLSNIFVTTPVYLSLLSSYSGVIQLNGFHFTVFSLLEDPGMMNVFGLNLSSWEAYTTFILVNYGLLNVSKGLLTTLITLPLRERLVYFNLFQKVR